MRGVGGEKPPFSFFTALLTFSHSSQRVFSFVHLTYAPINYRLIQNGAQSLSLSHSDS